jgi:hypothetical protein
MGMRKSPLAALLAVGLIAACAKDVPFERGLTDKGRKAFTAVSVRLVTVMVQDELGAAYHTRSTTAKLLNTAQIHGVAFFTKGALYIGPAPDSFTPWFDTSNYVPEGVQDMPGMVSALDPANALRVVGKIALAPILRSTEKSEHQESGKAAYELIASARKNLGKVKVGEMFQEDETRELKNVLGVKFATREITKEWPLDILKRGVPAGGKPMLLLFTQYTLTPDLRQLQVQTEATAMRAGDTLEAPPYRNRFVYESPRLPVPARPVEEGTEPTAFEKEQLAKMMLARWNKDGGKLLREELHRASDIIAADMAMDIAGTLQPPPPEPKADDKEKKAKATDKEKAKS